MSEYLKKLISIQKNAEAGNLEQAFRDCEEIIANWVDNAEALHLSGYILLLRSMPEEAIPRLLKAISEQPGNFVFHSTLAIAYHADGNMAEAAASFRRVLNLKPDDQDALVSLAEFASQKGIDPEGLAEARGSAMRYMGYMIDKSLEYSARANAVSSNHPGAVEMNKLLQRHLMTNVIKKLNDAVPDDVGRGKPKVIYPLRVIGRIGHLILEPFFLKCLYDPDEFDIIILTPNHELAVSPTVYDIAMRQTFPVDVTNNCEAMNLWGTSCGIHTVGDRTYVSGRIGELGGRVLRNMKDGQFPHRFKLNDGEKEQGQELRRKMGIPADAPIVTLYVREKGYLPSLSYHSIRNAKIENYLPAIKYLTGQGFFVVRIGDDKMNPLPDLGRQVIDAPFHPAYSQLVEPYFVSESAFMLKTISGPDSLSLAFGVPSLITNIYWQSLLATKKDDLCIPKKYYSHRYQRELTLAEIALDKKLMFSGDVNDFTARHIELLENTDEEILAATKEMVARLDGRYQGNETYDARFQKLGSRIHADCENDIYSDSHTELDLDFFGLYLNGIRISHAYCDLNPDFLW